MTPAGLGRITPQLAPTLLLHLWKSGRDALASPIHARENLAYGPSGG
jgi:hypothetical protein